MLGFIRFFGGGQEKAERFFFLAAGEVLFAQVKIRFRLLRRQRDDFFI